MVKTKSKVKKPVKKKIKSKNPETIFGYIPQIGNLSVREIESLISGIDEALELYAEGKSKLADARLKRLETRFGKRKVEKAYFYRKYNK